MLLQFDQIVWFRNPLTVDAVVAFRTLLPDNVSYAVRVNHSSVPPTQTLLNYFSPAPDRQYQMYWCALD